MINRRVFAVISCLPGFAAFASGVDPERDPIFASTAQRIGLEFFQEPQFADGTTVAFADFDGDDCKDALVAVSEWRFLHGQRTYLTVLLGNCDGSFEPPVRLEAGLEPAHAIPLDADGDGWMDIAAVNASDDTVSILINRGDGTFEEHVVYSVGDEPRSLVAEDLDGDGDPDLATLNLLSNDVSILLNEGDATFAPEVRVAVGGVTQRGNQNRTFPIPGPFLGAGDLDLDGDIDLAIPARGRVKLLVNDGAGGFALSAQQLVAPSSNVYHTLVADLTGDGAPDIASPIHNAADFEALAVVFRNDGTGEFLPGDVYDVRSEGGTHFLTTVAAGDLDRDGDADLVFGAEFITARHTILRNDGSGFFDDKEIREIHEEPWFVALEDLNGDGWLDLGFLTTRVRGALRVHLNDGAGALIGPLRNPPGRLYGSRHTIEAADLDGDGDIDLVSGRNKNAQIHDTRMDVLVNDGSGVFERLELLEDPQEIISISRLRIVDFRGDGVPEIIATDQVVPKGFDFPGRVWLIENDGALGFTPRVIHEFEESFPWSIDDGDVDGDGDLDLIISHTQVYPGNDELPAFRSVRVLLNRGDETFEPADDLFIDDPVWSFPWWDARLVDLDGDGDLDIAAAAGTRQVPGVLVTFLNDGGGSFVEDARLVIATQPLSIAVGDVDGDAAPELVVLSNHNFGLEVPWPHVQVFDLVGGRPELMFEITDIQIISDGELRLIDIDRDGYLDLVYGDVAGRVMVHRGRGDGTFEDAEGYDSEGVFGVAVADFNGDTRLDTMALSLVRSYSVNLNRSLFSACPADVTGSSDPEDIRYGVPDLMVTIDDFFVYLDLFVAGDARADISGSSDPGDPAYGVPDGTHDIADFFTYLDRFLIGCPA